MHRRRALTLIAGSAAVAAGLRPVYVPPVAAQIGGWPGAPTAGGWTPPTPAFNTRGLIGSPRIVADSAADIHLIVGHTMPVFGSTNSASEVVYSAYRRGQWSTPIDVLVSNEGEGNISPMVAIDDGGFLHVSFMRAGMVYHSRAHVRSASSARNWTRPSLVSDDSARGADIAVDKDGSINVVYTTQSAQVMYRRSQDGGETWGEPIRIADTSDTSFAPANPRIRVDGRGRIHVVWTQYYAPAGWPPQGVYYARPRDERRTDWSEPMIVEEGGFALITLACNGLDEVHLFWHGGVGFTADRRHRWSRDGGELWSSTSIVGDLPSGGLTGYSGLAFDSKGVLQAITSTNYGPTVESESIFYTTWSARSWSKPGLISAGATGEKSSSPDLVVAGGNQLHAVFQSGFNSIWHATSTAEAPR